VSFEIPKLATDDLELGVDCRHQVLDFQVESDEIVKLQKGRQQQL